MPDLIMSKLGFREIPVFNDSKKYDIIIFIIILELLYIVSWIILNIEFGLGTYKQWLGHLLQNFSPTATKKKTLLSKGEGGGGSMKVTQNFGP